MVAYYNEKDPFAAEWLRKLIAANMIAPGDVDERSIEDVIPLELAKYTQCHFFAGIGVWSYAMRRAGWSDDCHGWSGSCPCQPFSQAGQGAGFTDERHLWPAFFHLIEQCRPNIVFGEQVASPDGLAWLDLVQSDLEGTDYAFGALDQCVASFGAPHIRQRLYWMAYDAEQRRQPWWRSGSASNGHDTSRIELGRLYDADGLANNNNAGLPQQRSNGRIPSGTLVASARESTERIGAPTSGLADMYGDRAGRRTGADISTKRETKDARGGYRNEHDVRSPRQVGVEWCGPTNGYWRTADWLRCKDDKWRPVEPSAFPLAYGVANRVGLLRGYGNAIVAPQAEEFIKAAMQYAP
jgi:DNA (cytosine-5)-methyltransferase 1